MSTSEQICNDLQSILLDLQKAMETGIQYGGELFDRFVIYQITANCFEMLVSIFFIFVGYKGMTKCYEIFKDASNYSDEKLFCEFFILLLIIFFVIVISGGAGALAVNIHNIIQTIFLPELRLIEVLSNLSQ